MPTIDEGEDHGSRHYHQRRHGNGDHGSGHPRPLNFLVCFVLFSLLNKITWITVKLMIPDGKGSDNYWQQGCTYDQLYN